MVQGWCWRIQEGSQAEVEGLGSWEEGSRISPAEPA